ncbi:MAG: hypothetical protein GPJ54_22000 [Candidatus Heimdallarchaeota archaeon]|nr:hypothetical protein [Candidatus Heimdallarchaeota archaeon]
MQDPIEQLKIEHVNILRGLDLLTLTGSSFDEGTKLINEINQLIKFFRLYADDGHHAKEEAILFPRLKVKNPSITEENSPLGVLIRHHFQGRKLVAEVSKLDNQYSVHVNDLNDLLRQHIEIEDEIFPQLAVDNFDSKEIDEISIEFATADEMRNLNELLLILDQVENKIS